MMRCRPAEHASVFAALTRLGGAQINQIAKEVGLTVNQIAKETGLTPQIVWGVIQSEEPHIEAVGVVWQRKRSGNKRRVRLWRLAETMRPIRIPTCGRRNVSGSA
jgi:predicted transcriptional regulator